MSKFSVDWFSNNESLWRKLLVPKFHKKRGVRALEVGSYEGRSASWILDNMLTDHTCHLTCIDDFREFDPKSLKAGVKSIKSAFRENMMRYGSKLTLIEGVAENVMHTMMLEHFDFIYIDATKDSRYVLEHAVLAYPLLKKNGFLVLDDYTSSAEHDGSCPKQGIDAFLEVYSPYIKVIHVGWQVIVQKRATPFKGARKSKCYSELH